MRDLMEEVLEGKLSMETVKKNAEKEAKRIGGKLKMYTQQGGKLKGKHKYCAQLEGYVWNVLSTRFPTFYLYYEDLYMQAMLGILESADGYDQSKGKLTTYFDPRIQHSLCAWINGNVTFSTPYYQSVEKKINDALRKLGDIETVSVSKIVELTGLPEKAVRHVRVLKQARKCSFIEDILKDDYVYNGPSAIYYDNADEYYDSVQRGFDLLIKYDPVYSELGSDDRLFVETYWDYAANNPSAIYYLTPEDYYLALDESHELRDKYEKVMIELKNESVLSSEEKKIVEEYWGIGDNFPKKITHMAEEKGIPKYQVKRQLNVSMKKIQSALGA